MELSAHFDVKELFQALSIDVIIALLIHFNDNYLDKLYEEQKYDSLTEIKQCLDSRTRQY